MKFILSTILIFVLSTVLLGILLVACKHRQTVYETSPSFSYDTTTYNIPLVDTNRYFLITYETSLKEGGNSSYGNCWFSAVAFPNKKEIDSYVYSFLDYKKSCYQYIVVQSIFEFKNKEDFLSFTSGIVSGKPVKHKKDCSSDDIITFSYDSVRTVPISFYSDTTEIIK